MPGESLSFPITADDRASDKFRAVGNAALGAAGKIDLAAKALDLWDDTAVKSRKATDTLIASQLASEKAFNRLRKAAAFAVDEELKASALSSKRVAEFLNPAAAGPGFFKRTSTWPGLGRTLAGLLPGISSGAGGAVAGAAAGGSGTAGTAAGTLFSNPYSATATVLAGLAALPFAAQAAGTAVVAALGAAFTGVAVLGASKFKSVQDSFADIAAQANRHLREIGKPFVPVLNGILKAVMGLMRALTPAFVQFAKIVGPPFEQFGKTLVNAFAQPAVKTSIVAIGKAFAGLLTAFTPAIPGIVKGIALGFTAIANAVAKNPRAFVGFAEALGKIAEIGLLVAARLILVAVYIEQHFKPAMHRVAVIFDGVRHEIAHVWDQIFQNTVGTVVRFTHNVETQFNSFRGLMARIGHDIAHAWDDVRHAFATVGHDIATTFDRIRHFQGQFDAFGKDVAFVKEVARKAFDALWHAGAAAFDALRHALAASWDRMWKDTVAALARLRHDIAAAWARIWAGTTSQVASGVAGVVTWFRRLPGRVIGALFGLGHSLYAFAHAAMGDFWAGLKAVAGSVIGWVKNFVSTVWNTVKRFFGISSPSSLFYSAGKNLMLGLEKGIQDHAHRAAAAARAASRRVTGAVGGSVTSWIEAAIRGAGAPMSWFPALQRLVSLESGGNPTAVNPIQVLGQHASGLWQMLPSTFAAYGGRGSLFNPVTEGIAAIRYIMARYGSPFNIPGLFSGGYGGYALGGMITEPVLGVGLRSGRGYGFGERGPEMVVPAGGGRYGGAVTIIINAAPGAFAGQSELATGKALAGYIKKATRAGVRLYPSGVTAK